VPRPKPRSSFRTAADRDEARELPPLQPGAVSLLVQTRCHRRRNGVFGPTKTTTGLLARIAVVAVAGSSLAAGRAFERTMAAPHVSPVPYRLIQEPDAGYQPIIDLIRSAVSSVRMTTYAHAEDDAVTALADAHRRGVDVKVILDPHSTVSTPTKQPTMRFTPPASTSNGRPMMRSITRNHRRRPHYRRRRYRKPHQEVLRDLARCLHSHHQHQRRRHLRRRFHRRAPRRGQVGARSGIASAGVRSTSRPSSVPTRPARPQPMRRSASPGLTLFSQRAGLPPTTAWQERKTQPAPKAPAADRVPDKAIDEARLAGLLYLVVATKKCWPRTRRTPSVGHRGFGLPGHHRVGAGARAAWAFR